MATPTPGSYEDALKNYWAPDREAELARKKPGAAPAPTSQAGSWFQQQGFAAQPSQSPQPAAPAAQAFDRTKFRDQWMSSGVNTVAGLTDWLKKNPQLAAGVQQGGSKGDKIRLPDGTMIDAVLAAGQGGGKAGPQWTGLNPGTGGSNSGGAPAAPRGGGGSSASSSLTGTGSLGTMAMPTAPVVKDIAAPTPFTSAGLGNLANTPQMAQQRYNPAATPQALSYENLATPEGYTPEAYQGMTQAELESDPSYQFRLKAGQDALENTLARTGSLRGGNAANALMAQGQGMASQEYAAADARARATNAMNNQTSLGAYQTNAQTGLAYNQNMNAQALNFGQANIQNAFQANQANNQGSNAAIAANNQSALAQQQQGLAAQQQGYQQAAGTYGMNAGNALAFGQANNANALANYNAQANNALGLGNLNLGYTQAANQFALGQGNLSLGQQQFGLQQNAQQFGQAGATYDRNYAATVTDPWQQQMGLANLGNPAQNNAYNYGMTNQMGNTITDQGSAASAGQIASGNAWGGAVGNLGNLAQDYWTNRPVKNQPQYTQGQGQPPWAML